MDILMLLFSISVSDWLAEIIKEMAGDAGWSTVKYGVMKFIGRDAFEQCFDRTIEHLMKKYSRYWPILDMFKDLRIKGNDFSDMPSLLEELEKRGVKKRVARFLLGKFVAEYQKIIIEKAKENEMVFKHVVIGHLTSIHPILERNTEALERLTNIIEQRTRVWDSLGSNAFSSALIDNVPDTLRYEHVTKSVKILNDKGDAKISAFYKCVNGSSPLMSMKQTIFYSGRIDSKAITAIVNGKKVSPELETYRILREKGGKLEYTQTKTEIYVHVNPAIASGEPFTYQMTYNARAVYPSLFHKEYTSHGVFHPTARLTFKIECPLGQFFLPGSIDLDAINSFNKRMIRERERLHQHLLPIVRGENREIVWEIDKPRLACHYKILFRVGCVEKSLTSS